MFKLVIEGPNVVGLAPNWVRLLFTLSTSIWLAGLRIGSVKHQIGFVSRTAVVSAQSSFGDEQFG